MVGAAHLGERRVARLFAEFGAPVVEAAVETILDVAEVQARAVVSKWKDGVFYGEAFLDDDGHGRNDVRIATKVTKTGSDIEIDLSDSDPQSTSFVNSSHANMQAAVVMAFAYLIDPDIPKNAGALRPLKVIAKQGTIVWNTDPGLPVTLCTSHPSNETFRGDRQGRCQPPVLIASMAGWGRLLSGSRARERIRARDEISSGICFRRAPAAALHLGAMAGRRSANGIRLVASGIRKHRGWSHGGSALSLALPAP